MNLDWKPIPLKQTTKNNCGQTCVAMITHLSIDFIHKEFGHSHGTYPRELFKCLYLLGYDNDQEIKTGELPDLAILDIRAKQNNRYWNHWAVYHKGELYDTSGLVFDFSHENLKLLGYKLKGFIKVTHP